MRNIIFNCKFIVLFALISLIALLLTFATGCKDEEIPDEPWRLIVLHQELPDPNVQEITKDEQHVPILRILSVYGYVIDWETGSKATLAKDGKLYIFDLESKALYDAAKGPKGNLIDVLDGSTNWKCVVIEKDIFVDTPTMQYILRYMDENPTCEVNLEKKIIHFGYNDGWY